MTDTDTKQPDGQTDNQSKRPAGRQSVPIEQRIDDAIILMEDLADLLDEETDAIHQHDFKRFTELQADKVDLATEYQSLVGRLQKRQAEIKQLPEEMQQALRAAAQRLDVSMEDNDRQVDTARRGTRSIIDTIIEAARKAVATSDAYTEEATPPEKNSKNAGAVSIDEEL
tara:strand:- start:426 stop:935 length:510 start_codon:yes stop_codon:yes gene_type:complete